MTSITIPESVTSIGEEAFVLCESLTSITIPESVTCIGDGAFDGCTQLSGITVPSGNPIYEDIDGVLYDKSQKMIHTYPAAKEDVSFQIPQGILCIGNNSFSCSRFTSITIPESVTSIGMQAFIGCSSLTSITIPKGVTSIGDGAFDSCTQLSGITVSSDNPIYEDIDGVLFDKSQKMIHTYPAAKEGVSFQIPKGILFIADSSFYGCLGLTSITIPESVTSIGDYAFSGCSSLTSIAIPESVTSIGEESFSWCDSLTSITIPESVTSIGDEAFSDCPALNLTVIKGSYAHQYAETNSIPYNISND